ncbi:CDP-diacylglycerol--serine O-phosphatidyltransferase [candidate division LCP-89 bacterium B3_LCP]|uniref:CDP-diacylglycerol--serine O-phosphatidyltransferase n=1 Tax=candidate division LCP-89 bacterium B3_LCP TaxID=2012998 RepID=A0A532UZ71_UNCL8|nr:MAG: CDP-diacylglycerol--serine O-phosphatidyltransferase [candidate division LCP-89 bacterium B3_LCP]
MKRNELAWAAQLLTGLSLFLGFWAIVQAIEGSIFMACWLIVIAAICDGLDGKIARFTRSSSEMGIELDSLVDIVSFGVAPSVLLYTISFQKFGFAGVLLAALPLLFGVIRLARFNVSATTGEKRGYLGLPIPMQAVTTATFIVFNYSIWGDLHLEILLIPMTMALSILMVSHLPYDAMPRFSLRDTKKNKVNLALIVTGFALLLINPSLMFFPLIMMYLLKGLIITVLRLGMPADEIEEVLEDEKFI